MIRQKTKWIVIALLNVCFLGQAFAELPLMSRRKWQAFDIPGAKCGNGAQYKVFFSKGAEDKLAFDFMGGGVCWDFKTCFGPTIMTWIRPLPTVIESGGFVSLDPEVSPVADYSILYFPYCNGDLHIGTHTARYLKHTVRHHGRLNAVNAVKHLAENKVIDFSVLNEFAIYGYSAGALATFYHAMWVDQQLPQGTHKVLIADSPGLHFGPRYLDRFSPAFVKDIQSVFEPLGIEIHRGDGNLAKLVPAFCKKFPDWNVMALQGTKDIVMSSVFGKLSMADHRSMVYSPRGLAALTADPTDNCVSWIPDTALHTFLMIDATATATAFGKSATKFVNDAFYGKDLNNYVDVE